MPSDTKKWLWNQLIEIQTGEGYAFNESRQLLPRRYQPGHTFLIRCWPRNPSTFERRSRNEQNTDPIARKLKALDLLLVAFHP
jgi:hypothetical protein